MNPAQARVREIQDALNHMRKILKQHEAEGEWQPLNIRQIESLIDLAHEAITLQQTETYTWPG
jgi:hypothetical protein